MDFEPVLEVTADHQEGDGKFRKEVLKDFYLCCVSREASILARKEVLTGKAKFGITGDGKELAQVALAKAIKKGDFRAGYYRDQTLLFALGEATVEQFFAQLYADVTNDPFSQGRQMITHFASKLVHPDGSFTRHTAQFNSTADVSCTAGQVGRAVGLGLASKKYREMPQLANEDLSHQGDEVVICTIGDGSTSEGAFWESVNAAAVQKIPLAYCVWDDGYAISVPKKYQTTKQSISKALEGFLVDEHGQGIRIYVAKAWDYPSLCDMFIRGIHKIRDSHTPALFHVQDTTQPSGHSTSGSHQRYKPAERIEWEKEMDCIDAFERWIIGTELADHETLSKLRQEAKAYAIACKNRAWKAYTGPILKLKEELRTIILQHQASFPALAEVMGQIDRLRHPLRSELLALAQQAWYRLAQNHVNGLENLQLWIRTLKNQFAKDYGRHLYSEGPSSALAVPVIEPTYGESTKELRAFEVLNAFFDSALEAHPNLFVFGEDVGRLGDVNQGMMGMQGKHGEDRVFDTGIREWTIVGQAIGMAIRGLRPIAEIQYIDYLIYAMPPLADDLATISYRTAGIQKAPAIIRTRGHRLEGIWHTGSPMGMILHGMRGIYLLVPRNMVQAAGLYNTMLQSTDPAIIVECLNAYRIKEKMPDNMGEYTVPLGVPEILQSGADVTVVTYGACVRIAQKAATWLANFDISVELIDVQTLNPFDRHGVILESLKKTNRIVFLDEDVPGGATAFMMDEVIERQGGFDYLEYAPVMITARSHRTPYGSDGDYYAKPNAELVFQEIYDLMQQLDPKKFHIS
ncbi:MAG: transketolase [Saprospiraceae bacterium]|nr:transketolase [Saprospiraceae bacterium]